jgi:hypothetical protein
VGDFLEKWANKLPAGPCVAPPSNRAAEPIQPNSEAQRAAGVPECEDGVLWAEWKAAALNRLFQEQGVTGMPGRITAATVRDGEKQAAGEEHGDHAAHHGKMGLRM